MKTIPIGEFEQLVRDGKAFNLLDVRNRDAFQMGHIEGAVNVPVDELQGKITELDKDEEYFIICYSGNFSAMAGQFLTQNGFQASNIQGGMGGYRGPVVL